MFGQTKESLLTDDMPLVYPKIHGNGGAEWLVSAIYGSR